jgi:hypothetical protein
MAGLSTPDENVPELAGVDGFAAVFDPEVFDPVFDPCVLGGTICWAEVVVGATIGELLVPCCIGAGLAGR